MNPEEKFQEELKNLESRLQAALQGFKPLDGCVTSESVASCEHHGNYRQWVPRFDAIERTTRTDYPQCLQGEIARFVNKRTGYLLGGHQRLAVMDKHEKYKDGKNDYELDVALVDLPEKDELAMLVFLNNPSAQGTWQTDLLAEINLELGVSFDDMGFDRLDVDLLFDGDSRFSELFEDDPEVKETKASLDEIKAHRKESTEKLKEANSAEFYFVVVCKDEKEKRELLKSMKIPAHESWVSAAALQGLKRGSDG